MKRLIVVLSATCIVGVSGAAVASVLASSSEPVPSPTATVAPALVARESSEAEHERASGDAVHAGSIHRFHASAACALVDVSSLGVNWTHGDYVSAVAIDGDASVVFQAAQSDCGKPLPAAGRGGPPQHALANRAAGQAHSANGGTPPGPASSG